MLPWLATLTALAGDGAPAQSALLSGAVDAPAALALLEAQGPEASSAEDVQYALEHGWWEPAKHMLRTMRAAERASGGAKLALFRESPPQHFPGATGSGTYEDRTEARGGVAKAFRQPANAAGGCPRTCAALGPQYANAHDWRNAVLHRLVRDGELPTERIVPSAELLRPLAPLARELSDKVWVDGHRAQGRQQRGEDAR